MKITESSDMPPIDLVALGKMLGDEPALVQMILGKFRAEIAGDIAALGDLAASGVRRPRAYSRISSPLEGHLQ